MNQGDSPVAAVAVAWRARLVSLLPAVVQVRLALRAPFVGQGQPVFRLLAFPRRLFSRLQVAFRSQPFRRLGVAIRSLAVSRVLSVARSLLAFQPLFFQALVPFRVLLAQLLVAI